MTIKTLQRTGLFALLAAGLVLLGACTNSPYRYTKLVDVQPNTEAPAKPPYQTPVIGVLIDSPARALLENDIVAALRARGVNAKAAMPVFGHKGIAGKSRDYLAGRLRENGFDSAVSVELVDKTIQNLRAGGGPSAPTPTAGSFSMKPAPLGPDFSLQEATYVARVRFWDIAQQAVVWSATSVSHNPRGIQSGSAHFADTIASQLIQAGLFDTGQAL